MAVDVAVVVVIAVLVVVCAIKLRSCSCVNDSRSSWCRINMLVADAVVVGQSIVVVAIGRSVGRSASLTVCR